MFAFVSAPIDTPPALCSLGYNQLCGVYAYTAEGITKLCEGLKESAVTSLKYAATPECLLSCQRPLTLMLSHHPRSTPPLQSRLQQHRSQGRL